MTNKNLKTALKTSSSIVAVCALGAVVASTATAQETTADTSGNDALRQETITVTATRRAESIQDIPLNISAIGGDQIAQQGFGDISELSSYVPGLNVADQGGRDGNRIVVRGLNAEPVQNAFGQADGGGTVATYVGEIPLFVPIPRGAHRSVRIL